MLPTPEKNPVAANDSHRVVTRSQKPIWVAWFKKLASPDVIAPIGVGLLAILVWDILCG
jgi:hypothetical protein